MRRSEGYESRVMRIIFNHTESGIIGSIEKGMKESSESSTDKSEVKRSRMKSNRCSGEEICAHLARSIVDRCSVQPAWSDI